MLYLGNKRVCPVVYTGSGGGGGATVTATNVTGKAITKGDKVWLNKDVRTGGTNYGVTSTTSYAKRGLISTNGNTLICNENLYSLGESSATLLSTDVGGGYQYIRYKDDYIIGTYGGNHKTCVFKDGEALVLDSYYRYIEGSDNLFTKRSDNYNVYKIDLETGEILKTYTATETGITTDEQGFLYQYGNTIVGRNYAFDINEDGTLTNRRSVTSPAWKVGSEVYLTKDKKHLICYYSDQLRIGRIVDDVTIEDIPQTSLPEDLRDISGYGVLIYNPNNDILTLVKGNTDEFIVAKHNNGTLEKLNITLPFEDGFIYGTDTYSYLGRGITFSNDMSRAVVNLAKSTTTTASMAFVVDFESRDGYVAIPYKHYLTTQDTVTGVASDNAETGTEFEVSVNTIDDGKIFGATIGGFIGTIDENGVYQKPTIPMSLNFKGVKEISEYGLNNTFYKKHIESLSFPDLEKVGEKGLMSAFNEAIINGDIIFQNLTNIVGYGLSRIFMDTDVNSITFSALKTSDCEWAGVIGCKATALYFPELEEITGGTFGDFAISNYGYENMALQTISIPKLKRVTGKGKIYHIANTSQIKSFEFTALEEVLNTGLQSAFDNNTVTEHIYFPKLRKVVSEACSKMCYYATNLKSIYFNELVLVSSYSFGSYSGNYAFAGCKNLTEIHFRADMQEIISTMVGYADKWGATNATIYFDL